MMLSYNDFFGNEVIAFTTLKGTDFFLHADENGLTDAQKEHLSKLIFQELIDVANIRQVHGKKVVVADERYIKKEETDAIEEADALITHLPGLPLIIRTADCVPIFIYDTRLKAIGIVHAGWKGTKLKIAREAVNAMHENWGSNPQDLKVALGPSILKCCYEVDKEFLEYFHGFVEEKDGKLFLDLPAVNKKQLLNSGVIEQNIFDAKECTCCNDKYYSFRQGDEKSGRMASFIMLKKEAQ